MFNWKISYYENVNGVEKSFQKDFSSREEYRNFLNENPKFRYKNPFSFFFENNFLGNDLFSNDFFALWNRKEKVDNEFWFNLDEYENHKNEIENEKELKESKKKYLEETKIKLLEYKSTFEKEWKKELVEKINKDLEKVDEELKTIK